MSALATPAQVTTRLEGEVTPEMEVMIGEYLEDASDQARYHGAEWDELTCPLPVSRMVANSVARFIRNPDAFTQNRASDESLSWQNLPEEYVGTVYFTSQEVERLQRMGNPRLPKFGTIQMSAYSHAAPKADVHWPVSYPGGKDFPLWAAEII